VSHHWPKELVAQRTALLLAVGWVMLVPVADLTGRDIVLVGLLIIAPLLCGLTSEPRSAQGVGAVTIAIAAMSWAWNDTWGRGRTGCRARWRAPGRRSRR
jgi:hypothetical protein